MQLRVVFTLRVATKPYHFWFKSYGLGEVFSKVGQKSRSRLRGKKFGSNRKVLSQEIHM